MSKHSDIGISLVAVLVITLSTMILYSNRTGLGDSVKETYYKWQQSRILRHSWRTIAAGGLPLSGDRNTAALIEFADYRCEPCRDTHAALKRLMTAHRDLDIVYMPLLTTAGSKSIEAVRAAVCAGRQDRFQQMHAELYETDEWMLETDFDREALRAGVSDLSTFRACMLTSAGDSLLRSSTAVARQLYTTGTPAYATVRQVIIGAPRRDQLEDALRRAEK